MGNVVILVPSIRAKVFTGGLLTIFEYANGLTDLGHKVTVIPIVPSERPEWFSPKFNLRLIDGRISWMDLANGIVRRDRDLLQKCFYTFALNVAHRARGLFGLRRGAQLEWTGELPEADVTLATGYETALVAYLRGSGRLYYFAQHFEPFFAVDQPNPRYAELEARQSYTLPGMRLIANCSWLAEKLKEEVGIGAQICVNAIDGKVFFPDGEPPVAKDKFIVVSYGGRGAVWKGFAEAAEAVRLARQQIPHLEWHVFGSASLPADNSVAPFKPTGFIIGDQLRKLYSSAHVLLAPSWYESFPLYPLEAMACGTAVITTPFGVEDYAKDEHNALLVKPRDSSEMASAIVRLYRDESLRKQLGKNGAATAKEFTWKASVEKMQRCMELA